MTDQATQNRPAAARVSQLAMVDADIHPTMAAPTEAFPYLASKWHDFHLTYAGYSKSPFVALDAFAGIEPNIARRDSYPPSGRPPGADLDFMREQHLDYNNVEAGMLQPLSPNGGWQRNLAYGIDLAACVNEWQLAEWTSKEPRLKASITVVQDDPESAVREIRKHGGNRDFAQVILTERSVEPLGRKRHWPIFEAAVEQGLPIGIHVGGNGGAPVLGGTGWASYHIQQHQAIQTGMVALLASLILEGTFDAVPDLKIVLVEGGFAWVPAALFRLDRIWEKMRSELPNVKEPPSEIFKRHFWVSTQPMDVFDNPEDLRSLIEWIGWDRLLFATDYPHWDSDDPRYVFPFALTPEQKDGVFNKNAKAVLRL